MPQTNRTLALQFSELIPDQIEQGSLYITMEYGTAIHLCACGCGERVVTPLSPTDWQLLYDGESITLTPSIGNWSFSCRSHYWIRNSRIVWAETRQDEEILIDQNSEDTVGTRLSFGGPISSAFKSLWSKITGFFTR